MRKALKKILLKYETELQLTMPTLHDELLQLLDEDKKIDNTPEKVSQNKTPHYSCDFVNSMSRHMNEEPAQVKSDVCNVCFEVHSLEFRKCLICNEEHDGCCEVVCC
tara:strand:+ start:1860 stop:2180 length:321 start_codon:yes stop_codon:yes gene_type:complete